MGDVEASDVHARIEELHNFLNFSCLRPAKFSNFKSGLPDSARNLGLVFVKLNFLEDLLLAVAAEVLRAVLFVLAVRDAGLVVDAARGLLLCVVFHLPCF